MNFQVLRIVAILLILAFHYCWHSSGSLIIFSDFSFKQFIFFLTGSWGLLGVYCFVIVSAWFLCDKKLCFSCKKIMNTAGSVVFYTIFIYLTLVAASLAPFSAKELVKAVLVIPYNTYWYVTSYLLMILTAPFINKAIDWSHKKNLDTVKKLLLLLTILIPCYKFIFLNQAPIGEYLLFIYIYLLTSYFKHSQNCRLITNPFKKLIVIFSLFLLAECIISILLGSKIFINTFFNEILIYLLSNIMKRWNPILIYMAFLLFYTFKDIPIKYNKILDQISRTTLAIYVISENPWIGKVLWDKWLQFSVYYPTNLWLIHYILSVLIIFVVCLGIETVRSRIALLIQKRLIKLSAKNIKLIHQIDNWFNI